MKKELMGIFVCMILFFSAMPVIQSSYLEDNIDTLGQKYLGLIYVRGNIENLKEELHDGTI